jgi:DNA-binding NtrC family response regulator
MTSELERPIEREAAVPIVLVVDDEPGIRALLDLELSSLGLTVVQCSTGTEALGVLRRQVFDLVVTDVKMPGATGLDVLREVKARTPATAVIVLTGFTNMDEVEACRDVGAFELIHKPFELTALHEAVERALVPFHAARR